MLVYIKTSEGRSFRFPVPLVFLSLGLSIGSPIAGIAARNMDESIRRNLEAIDFKLLSKCVKGLKKYKGLRIIAVKSAKGEEVVITL